MTARERPIQRSRVWLVPLGAVVAVLIITFVLGLTARPAMALAAGAALAVAVWAVLQLRAERNAHQEALASWATSEAVAAERLRIARDLHDIVSHGLGMITVRAATARYLNEQSGRQDGGERELLDAIEDIESLSREATLELRRMLETLRDADEPAPRQPTDTLNSLPEIIASARRAGLNVELHQDDLGPVSPGAQLAICAIVREGLGNSARHAGFSRVQLIISRDQDTITITITDDGPSTGWVARTGSGNGLIGLRERVSSLGGTLSTGPHGAGYRLEATVPDREA